MRSLPKRLNPTHVFKRPTGLLSLRLHTFSFSAAAPTMSASDEYSKWTNEELVSKVTKLENELRQLNDRFMQRQLRRQSPAPTKKCSEKKFDPTKYNTRYVALKIAYLGQKYNGFEHHMNSITPLPTIEEEIWKALMKTKLIFPNSDDYVNWEGCEYSKCGRTDRGVSAFGQVIGLRVRSNRPKLVEDENSGPPDFHHVADEIAYPRMLNRVLPDDIRVLAWCPSTPPGFSARFSCRERRYRYFFTNPAYAPVPRLAQSTSNGQREGWLDLDAMKEAATHFVGLHDFRNFCKIDPSKQLTNFERRIFNAGIEEVDQCGGMPNVLRQAAYEHGSTRQPKVYAFYVSGSAFLWHQVRHMIAVLFAVGQGLEKPSIVAELLDVNKTPTRPLYEMADDAPLVLWECIFPEEGGHQRTDSLEWIPVDGQAEQSKSGSNWKEGRYGPGGINDVLWAAWRQKKIDEVLAGSLLDAVAAQKPRIDPAGGVVNGSSTEEEEENGGGTPSIRVFDGGNAPRLVGKYVPIMARGRMESHEVLNARYARRKAQPSQVPSQVVATAEDTVPRLI